MSFDPTNPLHLAARELLAIALSGARPDEWQPHKGLRDVYRQQAEQIMTGDLAGAYGEGED